MWDYHFFYAEKQLVKFRVSGFEFGVSGFGFRLEALNRLCSFVFCLLSKVKGLETVDNSTIQQFNNSTILKISPQKLAVVKYVIYLWALNH